MIYRLRILKTGLKEKGINYTTETIELLGVEGTYESGAFPAFLDISEGIYNAYLVNAKQLQKAGLQVETPKDGTVIFHYASMGALAKEIKFPFQMYISSSEAELSIDRCEIRRRGCCERKLGTTASSK